MLQSHGHFATMEARTSAANTDCGPNLNGPMDGHIMAARSLPPPEMMRQVLGYNSETGELVWKPRPVEMFASEWAWKVFRKTREGCLAFTSKNGAGYLHGSVMGHHVQAHRVAWVIYFGRWPAGQIDHINNDRSDNRLSNLREATNSQNHMNKPKTAANTSGYKGVSRTKCGKRWRARIKVMGKMKQVGEFSCIEEAASAYAEAAARLHGEFARLE